MAYLDTTDQREADRKARELGAVSAGTAYYPPRRLWGGTSRGWYTEATPFAIHYFNAAGLEVAHWIIALDSFSECDPPRVWHESMKPTLENIKF